VQSVGMGSWDPIYLLDPELSLSHGFKGYVNVTYVSETPARIIVSPEKVINYTIQLKLISSVPEFTETEVVFDPENSGQHGGGWGDPVPIFNDYIQYSPNGTILLRVDKPLNATMILSVPDGFTGMSAFPRQLIGVGIMADVPLVDAYGGGGLDRIPRDENAWVTATVLNFEPSPTLKIIEFSSDDEDIPRSLFEAIDKALLDAESVHEKEPSIYPHESRRFAMPIDEAEAIIHYFGAEIVEGRDTYEVYVSFGDYVFSIYIQLSRPSPTS
jgi:hypothetical protein